MICAVVVAGLAWFLGRVCGDLWRTGGMVEDCEGLWRVVKGGSLAFALPFQIATASSLFFLRLWDKIFTNNISSAKYSNHIHNFCFIVYMNYKLMFTS